MERLCFVVWLAKYNEMFPLSSKRKSIVFATPLVAMELKPIKMTQVVYKMNVYICIIKYVQNTIP